MIEQTQKIFEYMTVLKQVPRWKNLPTNDLRTIAEIAQSQRYEHGELICQQGEPFKGIYIVQEGCIQAIRREGGEEFMIAEFGPSESFGEAYVIEPVASLFSLKAKYNTVALVLDGVQFRDALQNLASLRLLLLTRLANDLRASF